MGEAQDTTAAAETALATVEPTKKWCLETYEDVETEEPPSSVHRSADDEGDNIGNVGDGEEADWEFSDLVESMNTISDAENSPSQSQVIEY